MSIRPVARLAWLAALLVCVGGFGCGDDGVFFPDAGMGADAGGTGGGGGGGGGGTDAGGVDGLDVGIVEDGGTGGGGGGSEAACSTDDIDAFYQQGVMTEGRMQYFASEEQVTPFGVYYVELRNDVGPGVYDLADTNFADCDVCVWAMKNCNSEERTCDRVFYASEGTVELTTVEWETSLAGTLSGVVFEEVTIEQGTNRSTPVAGGETFCGDGHTFDVAVGSGGGGGGSQARVGDTVADFPLTNCATGEVENLHDITADTDGLWMIASAGWCSACRQFIPQVIDGIADIPESELKMIVVVGEDTRSAQPTVEYCRAYAEEYGEDGTRFYIDHDGTYSFATTFSNMWPYPSDSGQFGLPWNAMIIGRGSNEYHYADGDGTGRDVNVAVNELLEM